MKGIFNFDGHEYQRLENYGQYIRITDVLHELNFVYLVLLRST
jgi:hypothetical protein